MPSPVVRDFVTHRAVTLPTDATIFQAYNLMRRLHVRHIPVTRDGSVVGIVGHHGVELAVSAHTHASKEPVLERIMEPVVVVRGDTPLAIVAHRMAEEKHPAMLVVEGGELSIFTTIDALRALERLASTASSGKRSSTMPPAPLRSEAPPAN